MRVLTPLVAAALSFAITACGSPEHSTTLEHLPATGNPPSEQSAGPTAVADADLDRGAPAISPETGYEDPVCRMTVAEDVEARHTHDEVTYGFCSDRCRATFADDPDAFLVALEE